VRHRAKIMRLRHPHSHTANGFDLIDQPHSNVAVQTSSESPAPPRQSFGHRAYAQLDVGFAVRTPIRTDPDAGQMVPRPYRPAQSHHWWATSTTSRLLLPGPVRTNTRKGKRARTPIPIVVWPSYVPPQTTCRNVRYPVTFVSLLGSANT
jgi:hypothetical protein